MTTFLHRNSLAKMALALVFSLFCSVSRAQDFLLGDFQSKAKPSVSERWQPNLMPSTIVGGLVLPFRDDFSGGDSIRPSSLLWHTPASLLHLPTVSRQQGIAPPNLGVCSFDGATLTGNHYEDEFSTGAGDSLLSLPFDLSAYDASDSLYLSFYVQRGGRNDAPETTDSLVLYFSSDSTVGFERVWGKIGGAVDSVFHRQFVAVDSSIFLRNNFRFLFVNFGSQNGAYDVWHLDLVEFDAGRTLGEAPVVDASPTQAMNSPLAPFSALPLDHFSLSAQGSLPTVGISNASSGTLTASIKMDVSDGSGSNVFSGLTSQTFPGNSLQAGSAQNFTASSPFSSQTGNMVDYGSYSLRTIVSAPGDQVTGNDTLVFHVPVDSIMGYDDGESDAAYGITAPRSFCQEFRLSSPDTLTAVWIYFTPYVYVSPQGVSYSMQNRPFRLSVWDTLVVDSFIVQTSQGMLIEYGAGLNAFKRYPLSVPLLVDTLFWLGLRQVDALPVGIGFDRNFTDTQVYYESSNGDFVPSTNRGTLMIRPEFARRTSAPVSAIPQEELPKAEMLILAPNPGGINGRKIIWKGTNPLVWGCVDVFSMDGRRLDHSDWVPSASEHLIPAELWMEPGTYLVRFCGKTSSGKVYNHTLRLTVDN